jgi:hypothetical protein
MSYELIELSARSKQEENAMPGSLFVAAILSKYRTQLRFDELILEEA